MKFDVVVGNPPYQSQVGIKKTEPIWNKFVEQSFSVVKDGGYVSLIHPSGWRSPTGKFKKIYDLITQHQLKNLSMYNFNDGIKTFGVGTNFDWYVVKIGGNKESTVVRSTDSSVEIADLTTSPFIPSGMFEEFSRLVAKDGEEKVSIIHSYSSYETRKEHVSETQSETNIHPCVYTIAKKNGMICYYSSTKDNGHFGIPKVIWTNGLGTYPIIDETGEYGLTQFAYAIADEVDNLENIKKALESEKFIKLMTYAKFTNNTYDYKIIATFKKDFWKEFV